MAGKTNFLEAKWLDSTFRTLAAYKPAAIYIGLFTAAPSDSGGGTEATGGNYARVQVSQADAQWNAPAGTPRSISNVNAITFPVPNASWGQVTHFGIFDASTSGNLLYWAALANPKNVNNGDPAPSFAAGVITVTED